MIYLTILEWLFDMVKPIILIVGVLLAAQVMGVDVVSIIGESLANWLSGYIM